MNATISEQQYDMHLKLLMLGDTGVGKTCLLLRYAFDSFSPTFITTIGIDFKIKEICYAPDTQIKFSCTSQVELDGKIANLGHRGPRTISNDNCLVRKYITFGSPILSPCLRSYFRGAHGILLVYDISERESFENIQHWVRQIRENADERVCLVLVGNKCDREDSRVVSTKEGEDLARRYGVRFFETSAKDNKNVDECYIEIARETKDALIALETERQVEASAAPTVPLERSLGSTRARRRCCV